MYADKICHNSVLSDHIIFILGWQHLSPCTIIWVQTACHVNTSCLEMGLKIMGSMTSLTTYCSIANISSWCRYSSQGGGPCDVTYITLTDSPTRWTGCNVTNNLQCGDNAHGQRRDTLL